MDYSAILDAAGKAIYAALALTALYGLFCVVLLVRRIAQKRFSAAAADEFERQIHDRLEQKDFQAITELCDSPPYWSKAVPQLMLIALAERTRPPHRLRALLAEKFEREILADLEYRTSWVATLVKSAPMLGLLGTVIGMINAFAKIAEMQQTGTDPSKLAADISFALFTTALGLTIAIPLVWAGALIHVRIGKLQDSVQAQLGAFLDDLETAVGDDRPGGAA